MIRRLKDGASHPEGFERLNLFFLYLVLRFRRERLKPARLVRDSEICCPLCSNSMPQTSNEF